MNEEVTKPDISTPGLTHAEKFIIVGLGASAGGIRALKEFFEHVPVDSGMAYVVILHLSPDHDSKLSEVIRPATNIPVLQVTEKTKVLPNHIYVVPPNQHLTMVDGYIIVSPNLLVEERRAPVDIFFRTLAESHGSHAVCVILSGTGANGSMGLKRIKEMGGAAFVQNPREAEFNEMPRNAISTNLVDAVLFVKEIPGQIVSYKQNMGKARIQIETDDRPEDQQTALREIFTQLRTRTGHDFSNYKRPTLLRRIERRIMVRNLPDLMSYRQFIMEHPEEINALLKDLLISVTNFFRDSRAFEVLEKEIVPAILKHKSPEHQVRIWIAGCATGEEAYSLAIICAEQAMNGIEVSNIQIFATDIDELSIARAREGLYTINDAADVSPERLKRFFNKEGERYRIKREIRDMVLFANHNFIKDPPFSHLDLISCRNVLIYLNRIAQERVMETFHFALNTGGFLFLGTSEAVDVTGNLYELVNRDQHIYKSRPVAQRTYPVPDSVPTLRLQENFSGLQNKEKTSRSIERITYGDLHLRLLEQYAAPSLIINEDYDIVHLSERAAPYLQFVGGELSQNLLKVVRPELRLALRSALYQASQQKTAVEVKSLEVNFDGHSEIINIHVKPVLRDDDLAKGFILVLFDKSEREKSAEVIIKSDQAVSRHLEEELLRLKAQLGSSNEQHEFQAEELKASNEELQAINEELRSALEELETSKEELQSMNEELRTVNQELKVKVEETRLSSNNLKNLINSTSIGTIFLDKRFRVAMFTPSIGEIFNLIPADIGRPLSDITHKLEYQNLIKDAELVIEKLAVVEREVDTVDGKAFIMRILPYRTAEDHINGIVITFVDITSRKRMEQQILLSEERYRVALNAAEMGTWDWKVKEDQVAWNEQLFRMLGIQSSSEEKSLNFFLECIHPEDREEVTRQLHAAATESGKFDVEFRIIRVDNGEARWMSGYGRAVDQQNGTISRITGVMYDIGARKKMEQQKDEFIAIASHELKTPVTSVKVYTEILQENFLRTNDQKSLELVQKLDVQIDRLHGLIMDLLDTSRIAENNLVLRTEEFNLNDLVSEKIDEVSLANKHHKFIFEAAKLPLIEADRERIGQVLMNLFSNAMKYSPNRGEIKIKTELENGSVVVSVLDSGIGISPGFLPFVFDRFSRSNDPGLETYPGMGLGLYISAGIIQRHGGTIMVQSRINEGARFSFSLPLKIKK